MTNVEKIYQDVDNFEDYAIGYLAHLADLLQRVNLKKLAQFQAAILTLRENGGKMILCGNGGSASTASHMVNDFSVGTRSTQKPFKALSLTDNNAVITAIGNDFGYDRIFDKQLESSLEANDMLVVISASGNSENLVRAVAHAKDKGNMTAGLLGFDGGKLAEMVDVDVVVRSENVDYGPVEDAHLIINHLLMNYFMRLARDEAVD